MSTPLKAVALVCSLNPSPKKSSSDLIARQVIDELAKHDVTSVMHRVVDYNVKFGVATDMGDGDEWPTIRKDILNADILLIATPIWMGRACSVASMVMERLDAELSETDDEGRPLMYGKVGIAAIVGNEDGAHTTSAELFQAMSDVVLRFRLAAQRTGLAKLWAPSTTKTLMKRQKKLPVPTKQLLPMQLI